MGINGTYGMSHYSFAIVMNPVADISFSFPIWLVFSVFRGMYGMLSMEDTLSIGCVGTW